MQRFRCIFYGIKISAQCKFGIQVNRNDINFVYNPINLISHSFSKDITMIKKTLATLMLVSVCSFSTISFAGGALEGHMETLAKNFKTFNKTTNQNDAIKALDNMRAAAVEAQKIKLKGQQDAKAPTSTQLYDQLIAEIDQTKALAQAGKLAQAKEEAKKIAAIRDQGHKLYR